MSKVFTITKRHYDIITKQAADNFPIEAGGFLGGKDYFVQAIQPIFNQHLENKTDTFAFTVEDIDRAHRFFAKHGLTYFGLYHTHPNGAPEPSKTDIDTGHRYHFIVAIHGKDPSQAVMHAFEIVNRVPISIPIQIITKDVTSIDIHNDSAKNYMPTHQIINAPKDLAKEAESLSELMENIKNEKPKYKKQEPLNPYQSDFSAFA